MATDTADHAVIACRSCGYTVATAPPMFPGGMRFFPRCGRCGDADPSGPMPTPDALRFARHAVEALTDVSPLIVLAELLGEDPWRLPFADACTRVNDALRNTDQPTQGKV